MVTRTIVLAFAFLVSTSEVVRGQAEATPESGSSGDPEAPLGEGPFVLLAPEWMPLVTAGYRIAVHRDADYWGDRELRTFHGFSFGLLAPLVATGRTDSRHRLALGAGLLVDFVVHDPRNPRGDPIYVGAYAPTRVSYVAGQLGLVWRAGGRTALLASAVWLPSRRRELNTYVDLTQRVLGRGRLSMGLVSRHLHVAVFVGFEDRHRVLPASWSLPRRREGRAQVWDAGLMVGSGW